MIIKWGRVNRRLTSSRARRYLPHRTGRQNEEECNISGIFEEEETDVQDRKVPDSGATC